MVAAGEGRDEERHGLVADELVHDAVASINDRGCRAVEPRHQLRELLRGHPLRERCRAAHVGEEERELDLGSSWPLLKRADTAVADAPVQARGATETHEAGHVPGWAEGVVTELAARIGRDRTRDPTHPGRPTNVPASVAQHGPPLLLLRFRSQGA